MKFTLQISPFGTERKWLDFINNDGIKKIIDEGKEEEYIGKTVIIKNSTQKGQRIKWKIADFNHDDSGYTVDLIGYPKRGNEGKGYLFGTDNRYETSTIRNFLIHGFYNGFSGDIKEKMDTMIVETYTEDGIITTNDKVKLLSCRELNLSSYHNGMPRNEGNPYPIFPARRWDLDYSEREGGYGIGSYWTRSGVKNPNNNPLKTIWTWSVNLFGSLVIYNSTDTRAILPVIRFTNK